MMVQPQSDPKSSDEKLLGINESKSKNMNIPVSLRNGGELMMNLPLQKFELGPPETRTATVNLDRAIQYELKHGPKLDPKMDPKQFRRTVSNRLSAQRSRQRKADYIHDMERKAYELEVRLIIMGEKMTRLLEQRRLLKLQNEALQQLLLLRQHQANLSQIVLEKNKAEMNRLKEVQKKALLKMTLKGGWSTSSSSTNA
ncbi:hypothetical protein C2S51_024604 [Perilla frutescens var. frutescens]|nr:hypothetical protein C2S51_024604 [Perilla frutescens var. frutescens]